jgi:hypothetical protein
MAVKERLNFKEPNGRKFSKTAAGADAAAATAYAAQIALITVGTLVSATQTSDVAVLPPVAAGTYSDATFHFRKGTDNANVHFEQLANSYAEIIGGVETGNVDISNGDIQGYAGGWSTANGGGWTLIEAHYVK